MHSAIRTRLLLPALAVLGMVIFAGAGWRYLQDNTPLSTTGTDVPDPAQAGDPKRAMEHSRKLLAKFRAIGFRLDPTRIPFSEWQLPDRRLFENPDMRRENITSYAIPNSTRIPEYAPIAFYTDLYVRRNISRYWGDRVKSRPTGFFIVAYKSGEVKRVPVEDARLIQSRTGALITGFPGMPGYDVNGRRLPFVEVAAPPDPPLARLLSRGPSSKGTPDSPTDCVKK